jgi:hypothetical protein
MGYKVLNIQDSMRNAYGPRNGLEGPFLYPNGRVAYYDPKEGKYYDPRTDFYLDNDEADELNGLIFGALKS